MKNRNKKMFKLFRFSCRYFLFFTVVICSLKKSELITLKCNTSADWDVVSCRAVNLRTSLHDRTVTKVESDHELILRIDFIKINIYKQHCPYIPKNISSLMPSIEIFRIANTNLRFLFEGDLDGFKTLKEFDASWNPIERLPQNFFKDQKSIETVSFYYCHLKVIDPQVLTPLVKLDSANFLDNICISNHIYDDFEDVAYFIEEIRDKCREELYEGQMHDDFIEVSDEPLPFLREHVVVIVSVLASLSLCLIIVLLRIFTKRPETNWNELNIF
jgi:hypothetical protein